MPVQCLGQRLDDALRKVLELASAASGPMRRRPRSIMPTNLPPVIGVPRRAASHSDVIGLED